jgi:hypothetical protein
MVYINQSGKELILSGVIIVDYMEYHITLLGMMIYRMSRMGDIITNVAEY